jgi:hypothetical protein
MEKMELWGKMNGIYKFLQLQKETYTGVNGSEVSGIEKMKENISATANSSNKEGYIKAIDCLQNGGDNILSGNECVSYNKFVNGGDDDAVDKGDDIPPPENVTGEEQQDEQQDEQQGKQDEQQQNEGDQQQEEPQNEGDQQQQQQQQEESQDEGDQQQQQQQQQDEQQQDEQQQDEQQQKVEQQQVELEQKDEQPEEQQGLNDNNADNLVSSPLANATTGMSEGETQNNENNADQNKVSEGGGRSKRHTKPSRRIKSRKSKKGRGRMTRRNHRGGRR